MLRKRIGDVCILAQIFYNCEERNIDFLISCLFRIGRVGTYRQKLHLFIKSITVCRKLEDKVYMQLITWGISTLLV